MRSAVDTLESSLGELEILVTSIGPVNQTLSQHPNPAVISYLSVRRKFDYAAFVVAIYAYFESFAEELIATYSSLIARRSSYGELPKELLSKHIKKTAEIIARGELGKGRYSGLSEVGLVKNLFECLTGTSPYNLNQVAIISHDRNLRYDELTGLFTSVGSHTDGIRRADPLVKWYCEVNSLDGAPSDGVPLLVIQERLNDLVERRNEVAHRGGNPEDLLGSERMDDLRRFMLALGKSMFVVLASEYLRRCYVEGDAGIALERVEGPFQGGSVWVVKQPPSAMHVGQPLFCTSPSFNARWGRIKTLMVDNEKKQSVDAGTPTRSIGVEFDFKAPKTSRVYLLSEEDDMIW